ncbi:MAG: carbonic anhydrase family protein [Salinivirgaceae bacterium]|nr:carbonic anhydrase family protein [Salinivirgaceae bacterium]
MKTLQLFLWVISFFAYTACSSGTKKDESTHKQDKSEDTEHQVKSDNNANAHWEYSGEAGPEKWADLCPAYASCSGERQSPIDLSSSIGDRTEVTLERTYNCISGIEFLNNGHSIQVNVTGDKPNTLTVNNQVFELKQFHFHCPSEHTLDGVAFAGEAHFVHVAENGEISVMGVFIKEGAENEYLSHIIPFIPENTGDKSEITDEICPGKVFTANDKYFIYEGSLTTPPCTEGVNWFVRRDYIEASAEQIEALKKAMPAHNARPVQPVNDREFGKLDE